jgi:hypothetical protein
MSKNSLLLSGAVALVLGLGAGLGARPGADGHQAFEKLKSLAGHWEGETEDDATITSDIEVASDGHSVLEKLRMVENGKAMNMITVYYLDGDTLKLTHYCHAGNQPTMAGRYDPDANTLTFDLLSATNLKPGDLHMHHAVFSLVDATHFREAWTMYQDGKSAGMEILFLSRPK